MQVAGQNAIRSGEIFKDALSTVLGIVREYAVAESERQGQPQVGEEIKLDLLGLSSKLSHYNDDKIQPCGEALLMSWAAHLDAEGRLEQTLATHMEDLSGDDDDAAAGQTAMQAFLADFRRVVCALSGNAYIKQAREFRKRLHRELCRMAKLDTPTEAVALPVSLSLCVAELPCLSVFVLP